MIIPKKINIGDKIGILATARKISIEELNPAIAILESWGLEVVLGKFLFEDDNQFAGTIDQRAEDLQHMIDNDEIKGILCARGGYGTVQIIDKINFDNLYKNPKWIIGYSDITVLHSHLHQLGLATLHATMPINFSKNTKKSLDSLYKVLFASPNIIQISTHKFNKLGNVEGEIVGGNLSVLSSLLGSSSDINTNQKILFLEDLDEYLYHIDRMIVNMKRNKKFNNLKAMIIGGLTDMNDNDISFGKTAEEIILGHVNEYNFPLCFGFPCGHIDNNSSIILGAPSVLDIHENGVNLSQYY
ncbi:MAG: LD-carboxypeptidase [Bacteroidota bacterium]|nr:LD-carboxypeptidase [Bacteroidota bacterium]